MELILIRHGLPMHVENIDENPADPPPSDIGHAQVELMANWLQHESIDHLYQPGLII